ncbi:HNH endonuclease signature motif containing protein [Rhizorhabdus sp.]|uniref:HNH endonuclease n=1 Tax=Rhizorhabdus sp. TaxID=1968843 RepID=UPI0019977A38|nr:HNH endonuclease signature motif containing protein [Rhizorhabdus sp.]MBD3762628.1 HNH endonuclease [Rhizorhabdus sp.]
MIRSHVHVNPGRERLRGALYRAQGGRCGLCGARLRNMLAVTLDHVVPRALGGSFHGNLLAAHLQCNVKKADRAPTGCELIWLAAVNAIIPNPERLA